MSAGQPTHHEQAAEFARHDAIRCTVLTVSDTRTLDDDSSGDLICEQLNAHNLQCVDRAIVRDDPQSISHQLELWLRRDDVDAILTTGGTGIAQRDTTIEIVNRLIDKRLDGFGELFRMLSYEQVQSAAMLSRATAGLYVGGPDAGTDTFLFAMPGSRNAVALAMEKLIMPELPHLAWERAKQL